MSISHLCVQYHSITQVTTFFGRNYPLQGLEKAEIAKRRDKKMKGLGTSGIKMQGLEMQG